MIFPLMAATIQGNYAESSMLEVALNNVQWYLGKNVAIKNVSPTDHC